MGKLLKIISLILFFSYSHANAEDTAYAYGGIKIFNYGVETSDLQEINTSLIALGFSSSLSETDNTGVGFDLGLGFPISENLAVEGGYVNYGTLEITTTLTGPSEKLTTEISGDGVTFAGVIMAEGAYVKAGMHSWDFSGKVSSSKGSSSEPLGTGTDPFFGVGFIADNIQTSFEYYAIEDGDITSLGIAYRMPF